LNSLLISILLIADELDSFIDSVINALDNGVNLKQLNQILKQAKLQNQNYSPQDYVTQNARIGHTYGDKQDNKQKNKPKYDHFVKRETKEPNSYQTSQTQSLINILKNETEDVGVIAFSAPTDSSNWEFTSSLLFVTSIVTTIGYGHITPITVEGKVFCIIFSCVAIPFTLLFLSIIVSLIQNGPIKMFEKWLIKFISKYFRISLLSIRILHLVIVTVILLVVILILPALFFYYSENNWSLLDSFYYCYISLTTVGLGDFVPANADVNASLQLYRLCMYLFI